MEEMFFFKNSQGDNLLGVLHYPEVHSWRGAMVMCAADGEEKHESHRVLVNAARFFGRKGFLVLRFDYYGTGDSEGEWENSTIQSRLEDINSAVEFIQMKIQKNNRIGLMGIRLGATLAALAAEKSSCFSFLILWEPLIVLRDYLYQWLRTNLTTQYSCHKKIMLNRNQLIEQLINGDYVNLEGFLLSPKMYKQLSKINLLENQPKFVGPVFVGQWGTHNNFNLIKVAELYKKNNLSSQFFKFNHPCFWVESRPNETFKTNLVDIYDTTIEWLSKCF